MVAKVHPKETSAGTSCNAGGTRAIEHITRNMKEPQPNITKMSQAFGRSVPTQKPRIFKVVMHTCKTLQEISPKEKAYEEDDLQKPPFPQ